MLLIAACAGTPDRGATGRYGFDSASAGCRQNPGLCARMAGEEAVLPGVQAAEVVASSVRTGIAVLRVLEEATRAVVEKELTACADLARSKVLVDLFGGRSPTLAECNELVDDASSRRQITRAMQLGCLMHEVALACTRKALDERLPGRFSLEQRYRYDRPSGTLELVSRDEARSLLRAGCGEELKGTLVPDVVIHSGDPLEAQAVYDFKFPCVNSDKLPRSRQYPPGHPHEGLTQEEIYEKALNTVVRRIVPRVGVIP
ncbi:hypothetical protein [Pyxidicoccus sp. MSG2]|uniref:hypothetical protein n=1 Tax=Pyxidicoccus sp. MSG2 TaxID=2996790 RepID=UPI00226EC7DA|nr:hypothetical protein [Pyxidicoccus sp. MSG2]MCY1014226.1 hypothetical protein [Pyxidicoccus sp. MSG2]